MCLVANCFNSMKLPIAAMPILFRLCLALVVLFGSQGFAQDAPAAPAKADNPKVRVKGQGDRKEATPRGGEAEESAEDTEGSREDHEELRRLLGKVWDDPAVAQSREEVRLASDNFRKVLHAKIAELDPEAAELMEEMKGHSRSSKSGGDFGGGSRGMRPDGHRTGLDYMARPPFYASLDKEQRGIYDNAYKAAIATDTLKGVIAEMRETRQQDDELRKVRTTQFVRARKLLNEEMIKADPRVGEYFSRANDGAGARSDGKDGQKKVRPVTKP